jgi:hypothetical protein
MDELVDIDKRHPIEVLGKSLDEMLIRPLLTWPDRPGHDGNGRTQVGLPERRDTMIRAAIIIQDEAVKTNQAMILDPLAQISAFVLEYGADTQLHWKNTPLI